MPGRVTETPAEDVDGVVRVLVYHDMEGLTGQSDPNTFRFAHPERYAMGRAYLTGDVNAVVAGLLEGGADEVHIVDGHGSGNPDPDLLLDELDDRAELVSRDEPFDAYVDLAEAGVYDAVAVVGMHAKTGSGGFASHTYTLGIEFILNGMPVTETEVVGYSWGRVGVPVIFASGDDRLAADLEGPMPWVEMVTVKTATSASSAEPRPVDEARADLRAGARRAIESYRSAQAMRLGEPVIAQLHAVPPADLSMLDGVPGIDYADQRVTFTSSDFRGAYDGLVELVTVARGGYASVMGETGRAMAGPAFAPTYSDALFDRWMDFESGRWSAPSSDPAERRTYHGFH
ncbi:MAG: hypothetical protein HKN72_01885 [Gemmatimonadetes bacterium]|nr:hypothetical protein [Gemmatimonadota bacterium]